MNEYRIVTLTSAGRIKGTFAILCETDEEARQAALDRAQGSAAQVWSLGRHVCSYPARRTDGEPFRAAAMNSH